MLYQLPCEDLQTFLFFLIYHRLDHLRSSSCQQWVSIYEYIQLSTLQIPLLSIFSIQSLICIVSFQQYYVFSHYISLTLYPNYPINQFRLHKIN